MKKESRIIIVTGANRGIGFETVRQLATAGAQIVLTARKPEAGAAAVDKLAKQGLTVQFHPLDVTQDESLAALAAFVAGKFGRLDVLINNAGVMLDADSSGLKVSAATVRLTLETNTLGPLRVSQALAGLLRKSDRGRIINVASGLGALSSMGSDHAAYRISKAALNAVTGILAAELADTAIVVNSMCPGWVKTDMGGPGAEREVAQGADTAVWLALEAPASLTGKFVRDRQVIPW